LQSTVEPVGECNICPNVRTFPSDNSLQSTVEPVGECNTDTQDFVEREKGETNENVAKQSGFGNRETYRQAKYIDKHADEETIAQLDDGQLSVNRAYTELKAKLAEKEKEAESERQQRQRPPVIKISTMSSTVMAPASDGFPSQTVVSASTSM
ncbi:MAG TPA: hypothetical protein VFK27_07100, partial [Bacillales bacterium]|nr:hypothetical protein [Bacillales bacterium]